MNRRALILFLTIGALPLQAQSPAGAGATLRPGATAAVKPDAQQDQAGRTAAAKIDPAKEADIRGLLDLVGTKALITQSLDSMSTSMRPVLSNSLPPGDYRDKLVDLFFVKFNSKIDVQHFLDMAVPIYDKNFSHDEIRGLLQFYQTPLGQKTITVLPSLSAELQQQGRKWGEQMGRQCMLEVLAEHPDLAEAVTEAQKTAHSASR